MARNFQRPETVKIKATIRDTETDALTDPATSIKITVTDPDGTAQVDAQDMTKLSTGIYSYDYTTQSDDTIGWWIVVVTATDTTKVTVEYGGFTVE
jgi:hypothetical protein